jgi:hypothetical protein
MTVPVAGAAALAALTAGPAARSDDFSVHLAAAQATLDRLVKAIDAVRSRAVEPARADDGRWIALFDGRSLDGWRRTDFAGAGGVRVEPSFRGGPPAIVIEAGVPLTGINRVGPVRKLDYEIELEVLKIEGNDFPCGLTFPVGDSHATLILGGWGGGTVGISSIDDMDASENETTRSMVFPAGKWFRVLLRVRAAKLEAWLDGEKIVDQPIAGRKISLRPGPIDKSRPLGIATYRTSAAIKGIRLRSLPSV